VTALLKGYIDERHIHQDCSPVPGSEDFSFMLQEAPGLMMFLGVAPRGKDPLSWPFLHNPSFDIDETALSFGVKVLARIALVQCTS